jgi:nucleotide-binding universal stress UspA family protein
VLRDLGLRPQDVVVIARSVVERGIALEALLGVGPHHVLLAPDRSAPPTHVLICTAAGEPAKDVLVAAGRIVRHFGVPATILTAVPEAGSEVKDQVARFHDASIRTLSLHGIRADSEIRIGPPAEVIRREVSRLGCDLLVLGSPRAGVDGTPVSRIRILQLVGDVAIPTLLVRHGEGT